MIVTARVAFGITRLIDFACFRGVFAVTGLKRTTGGGMMNKNQIHETIMNYSWMMKLLVSKRLQTTGSTQSFIARYGDEASLPSGNDISDPVYQEMLRLERYDKNTRRIRKKVVMIQKHSKAVTDTKDQLILDGLLDGQSMREIAIELDMSLTAVKNRKDFIVNQIYQSVQNEQSEQYVQTAR